MDNFDRECDRNKEKQRIENNAYSIAQELRKLYQSRKKYHELHGQLISARFKIEDTGEGLKIWRQI